MPDHPQAVEFLEASRPEEGSPASAQSELNSLQSRALSGTAWTVCTYGVAMAVRLAGNVVLSRLLVPQYLGLMALLNSIITGLILFSDLGLNSNIVISRRGDEPVFLNTAWTLQVLRGLGLFVCCLALCIPFANFYSEHALRQLIPVIGLSLVISGFNSTSLATLERHLAARTVAITEISVHTCQLAVTVVWAMISGSIWALVGGKLVGDALRLFVSWRLRPEFRNSFKWDAQSARQHFASGKWIFLSTSLFFLASQSDRLILGKLVSFHTLGLYGVAFALADMPRQVFLAFSMKIATPFVAKFAHLPRQEFFSTVLRYRRVVLIAAAVGLTLVVTTGDIIMWHIYDVRFHQATWIVPILALGLWHTILYSTTNPCLYAVDKRQYAVFGYLATAIVMLTMIPLAFYKWGVVGAVIVVAFSDLPVYLINSYGMFKEGGLSVVQDGLLTVLFLGLLGAGAFLRVKFGFPLPALIDLH